MKKINGETVNPIEYSVSQKLKGNAIHIGCDSAYQHGQIKYVTVIAYPIHGNKGVHFIFDKIIQPAFKDKSGKPDIFTRLFTEAQYTIQTAESLVESGFFDRNDLVLEFDYNNVKQTISTKVISSATGWAVGLGYDNLALKHDKQIAVKAANQLCQ